MVRDGLAYLPDYLTAGDMSDIVIYLCTVMLIIILKLLHLFFMSYCFRLCVLCTLIL